MGLSISPLNSIGFCFIYFEALWCGTYTLLCLPGRFILLSLHNVPICLYQFTLRSTLSGINTASPAFEKQYLNDISSFDLFISTYLYQNLNIYAIFKVCVFFFLLAINKILKVILSNKKLTVSWHLVWQWFFGYNTIKHV